MSKPDIYGSLKMAHWAMREGYPPKVPKQVQLIISDLCNQDCVFCAYRMSGYSSNELFVGDSKRSAYGHDNPVRFIPTDRAIAFLDEFKRAGVLAVQLTGGGEPSANKDHEKIFSHALDIGLAAALVSNGLKWSSNLITNILPRFTWVRVSVDAGTDETYSSIRQTPHGNFQKVLGHVSSLAKEIERLGTDCTLGIGFVVTPDNYKEIVGGVRCAKETGARYIRLSAMFNPDGASPYEPIYEDIKLSIEEARMRYDSPTFTTIDLFGDRIQDLVDGSPDYRTCSYQSYVSYVGGDMRAYRCCVYSYSNRGLIAGGSDLAHTPWDVFWNSPERIADFENFDARGCGQCQFNKKNRAMAYLIEDNQPHKEFP